MTSPEVPCPHCGTAYQIDACDGDAHLVTYWGEEGPHEVWCGECGTPFLVRERVARIWEAVDDVD